MCLQRRRPGDLKVGETAKNLSQNGFLSCPGDLEVCFGTWRRCGEGMKTFGLSVGWFDSLCHVSLGQQPG